MDSSQTHNIQSNTTSTPVYDLTHTANNGSDIAQYIKAYKSRHTFSKLSKYNVTCNMMRTVTRYEMKEKQHYHSTSY